MIVTESQRSSTRSSWWLENRTQQPDLSLLGEHACDRVDSRRVQPGQRLIEDEQLRVVHQRGRELDTLLVAV